MNSPKNILIVRTDRIGDVVLALPMAHSIHQKFPDARISFLVRQYTLPLAAQNKFTKDTLVLKELNGRMLFWQNLRQIKNKFDTVIVSYPTFKLALLIFFAGIKNRIGTGYRWYSFLFNKKIYEHRKYGTKHELEHNLELLKLIGVEKPADIDFGISIKAEDYFFIKEFLNRQGVNKHLPLVIVHPGSGGSAIDLPFEKMKELVILLAQEDIALCITGTSEEKELCDRLIVSPSIINMAGKLSLEQLMALISQSDLLIANSTGPIHIAAALGKWTIGFYPKIASCSPTRWRPYSEKSVLFQPMLDCKNCTREQCEKLNCMNSISIEAVYLSFKDIIHKIRSEQS